MSWKCGTCEVILALTSKSKHLQSLGHRERLDGEKEHVCKVCKVNITHSNISRHKSSHIHIAALAMTTAVTANVTVAHNATIADQKVSYSALDRFVIEDVARYIQWTRESSRNVETFRTPRLIVDRIINNLYGAIASRDMIARWWPRDLVFPVEVSTWRHDIMHNSISDVAMAESVLVAAASGLVFESRN